MNTTIDQQKKSLRQHMQQQRAMMQHDNPQAGQQLAERLLNWSVMDPRQIISAYWSINSEIDIRFYIEKFCVQNRQIALPITDFDHRRLTFHLWSPRLPLILSSQNIMQPDDTCLHVEPDIILLPLLAFDLQGNRLGYGQGHYDQALQQLRLIKPVITVGVGYDAQLVAQVPCDEHDQRLDYIVTPKQIYYCKKLSHI